MTQQELTVLNLGQSLDDLANLDPRGYGVCKILYQASRKLAGQPTSMNAAQKLVETVKEGDVVLILTGFVLRPYKKAETDGIISSLLLCRSLLKAFGAKPVVVCPENCRKAVENLAACLGLHLFEDLEEMKRIPVSMGMVTFTKDAEKAPAQAREVWEQTRPTALVSIECPGANALGVYHNAVGLEVTQLEAKMDALFELAQEKGILNIAIGDLGNEIGMGAIAETLEKDVPYTGKGLCRCGCGGGIAVKTKAEVLITATVSDWGCYAMIAALAYLMEDVEIMHTPELEKEAMTAAARSCMIDMYGWMIPAIDGFGTEICLPIVALMREMVKSALGLKETCKTWFEKVLERGYFERKGN